MKKNLLLLCLLVSVASCNLDGGDGCADENCVSGVESFWEVREQLVDTGNGNPVFEPTSSQRTITFFNNGNISSSGTLCEFLPNSTNVMEATITAFGGNNSFSVVGCNEDMPNETTELTFERNGNELIVYFNCTETCALKFERVN